MKKKLRNLHFALKCCSACSKKEETTSKNKYHINKVFNLGNSIIFLVILFLSIPKVNSQVITPMTLPFERICADSNFNEFNVTFEVQGFPSSASYVVELSDVSGDFTNPTATILLTRTDLAVNRKIIKFAVPQDLIGSEKYSLRVKEQSSGITSTAFSSFVGYKTFSVYYKIHNSQFTINSLKSTAVYCIGGSYVLSIDPQTGSNNSPLKYPSLRYNWYKNNGPLLPERLVATNTNGSYTVTEEGLYYAETNYGDCSSNSYSNQVLVTESADATNTNIISSLGNPFCPADGATILSVAPGTHYQWFKDGARIDGATNQTYSTTSTGLYTVIVGFNSCDLTGSINLQSQSITATSDVSPDNSIDTQNGETLAVTITTDAENPSYQWYVGGDIISEAKTNTYMVRTAGIYKVIVTQNTDCMIKKEIDFQVTDASMKNIPNIISLSSAFYSWDIPAVYKNADTNVKIISSNGEVIFNDVDYNPSKWEIKNFKSINPVYYYIITTADRQEKKGSITIIK